MDSALDSNVLVLNKLWQPIHTCSVRRALKLLCLGHAQVVEAEGASKYQTHDLGSWLESSAEKLAEGVVRSVRFAMRVPKVIVLAMYDQLPMKEVRFTRRHVFLRDHHTCQYCGDCLPEHQLNLDHVIPRARGGRMSWENIVTSCFQCNNRKANKLPHEAKMFPRKQPEAPRWRPLFGFRRGGTMDDSWESFLY
ncbi:HNH endonuclease [Verrucomicrobiaceae bacterium N1E253]|uniref:HNH endonuclease n=1 Tax=Oceaniferula marina TaxID=2748318 RepID=A0A851GB24_9BACT|nr:HNH endonuclease [Oceaniferula marina]NWK54813.1 HNH endonuclease [Oceaniferula marina]